MKLMNFFFRRAYLLLIILSCSTVDSLAQNVSSFPTITLSAGIHLIKAEVASTEQEREQGLMYRKHMGANEGMLFSFNPPTQVCMWMKNTLIPLSVAFIDAHGAIINIEEMRENTTNSHCSEKPAHFALEMNRGWFAQKHIQREDTIQGLPSPHR